MRNIFLAAIATISILSATAGKVSAQASADANVSATITTPQAMEKSADLEIHTITKTRKSKGHTATTTTQDVTPAAFTLSGTPAMSYGVIAAASSLSVRPTASYRLSATGTDKLSITAQFSDNAPAMAMNTSKNTGLDVTIVYN